MSVTRRLFLQSLGAGVCALSLGPLAPIQAAPRKYRSFSGVYPHLAMYNREGECGTGAVVPWAGRLWVISYGPHLPFGSSDKLYEIDENLDVTVRPESVGGTHANRFIHRESEQLFIGAYVIDNNRRVRVIPHTEMPGRLTGTTRHLVDPAGKVYFASMEEGFYEVDVKTLAVKMLYQDGNAMKPANIAGPLLPGYHGKGLYSGQGRLVYANNGENTAEARKRPDIDSGCLAEWNGKDWHVVRRNQFTEVAGPGGITGYRSADDPIWSTGWDHRSALLMVLDHGAWHAFRMPKASHTYDGAHGWHTEWPRIREVGRKNLLMTMHGAFWDFPANFSAASTAGIRPLSTYLKIIGDFCSWNGRLVMGCDDAALSAFSSTGGNSESMVGQSNSNLWFVDLDALTSFGTPLGHGAVWVGDSIAKDTISDPFLVGGFERRVLHLHHDNSSTVTFTIEADAKGDGTWTTVATVKVPAGKPASGYTYHVFPSDLKAEWVRVRADRAIERATAQFELSNRDLRPAATGKIFAGLAKAGQPMTAGLLRARGEDRRTLQFVPTHVVGSQASPVGYYEIGEDMRLVRVDDRVAEDKLRKDLASGDPGFTVESGSLLFTTAEGKRYRLPLGHKDLREPGVFGWPRTTREVATERSVLYAQGNLFELPRDNSGGFALIRPIASTDRWITDMASWRGMLVLAGVADAAGNDAHVIRSEDGKCALWFGVIDDLWQLGKARGEGYLWQNTSVRAGEPSDPYLMTGYDDKSFTLSHSGTGTVPFTVEIDLTGNGHWVPYGVFDVRAGTPLRHRIPEGFGAYWVRVTAGEAVTATAHFLYR